MSNLDRKISEVDEREFELRSSDFFRPPLKQIGNSIYEIKTHFMCKDAANIIPGSCSPHLTEMRDTLLRHLEQDSFLYQKNIVTGSPIGSTSTRKPILSSFAVLVDSFSLAIDFEVSPRPGDVLCDILLAICGQPVIVLTVVDEDKDSRTAIKYNTSVARGVTTTFRTFMDESINVVFGVLSQQDLVQTETFSKSLETFGINSSMFVTACTFETSPSKYEKIVTAFWAGVAETRSVISRDGRVDTDHLRFLTKDQCIILIENINKREVEVQFQTGTGATTLMVEVARRLSRLNETLLVCRSQEEKERLKSVYPNTETVADLRLTDLSKYTNIVDETGTVTSSVSGKLWSFTKVYSETEELQNSVEMTEKQNANTEKMIFLLSSADRRDKMNHLLCETEILELFDINFEGLLSAYLLPSSLVHEIIPMKYNPDEGDRNRRLETEDYMRLFLDQLKRGIEGRQDLFPLLADMMKQVKGILPYLQAKTDYLKLATSDKLQAEDMKKQTGVFTDEGLRSLDHEKYEMVSDSENDAISADSENETASTKSPEPESEDISPVQGGKPEVPQCSDDISELTEVEKNQELKKKLKILKKEADRKQQELKEVREGTDHGVEWEYNMDCLSQNMAQLKIQDVITDVIGEGEIPVTTNKTVKSSVILGLDNQGSNRRGGMRRSQAHQLRQLQYGTLRRRDLFDIMRNVITDDHERLTNLRTQSDRLERVYGSPFHMVGEINTDRSGPVSCPPMTFNRERVHEWLTVSGDGLQLVNSRSGDHHDGQFGNYCGTCSRLPIPLPLSPSTLTVPQYWETHSRVQVEGRLYGPPLEMGLCWEGEVDTKKWVYWQTRSSWSIIVRDCGKHDGYYCTQVWENGRPVGGCHDTVSHTPGTHLIYKWGIALDMGRGRLAFLDVKRGRVLHRFDIKVDEPLVPMFGVRPFSDDPINMRLVSGSQLPITDTHKHLIAKALYSP